MSTVRGATTTPHTARANAGPTALDPPRNEPLGLEFGAVHSTSVNIDDLDPNDERLAQVCRRYGVGRLEVFGSVSRGDAGPTSDIDVLYELAPGARLGWEIENLADELAAILGRPVDLVSRRALHERLRVAVLAEARLIYAA